MSITKIELLLYVTVFMFSYRFCCLYLSNDDIVLYMSIVDKNTTIAIIGLFSSGMILFPMILYWRISNLIDKHYTVIHFKILDLLKDHEMIFNVISRGEGSMHKQYIDDISNVRMAIDNISKDVEYINNFLKEKDPKFKKQLKTIPKFRIFIIIPEYSFYNFHFVYFRFSFTYHRKFFVAFFSSVK